MTQKSLLQAAGASDAGRGGGDSEPAVAAPSTPSHITGRRALQSDSLCFSNA